MHGSFLNRTAEAKKLVVSSSPVRGVLSSPIRGTKKPFASPLAVDVARRKLHVDEDSKQEFVVISSSPSRKRVLTEHQKEVLSTKRVTLAMYNDLEQSQDTQAFKSMTQSQSQPVSPVQSEKESSPPPYKKQKVDISFSDFPKPYTTAEDKKQDENQKGQRPARRIVTLFQPGGKSSSPIKDSGKLVPASEADAVIQNLTDEPSSNSDVKILEVQDSKGQGDQETEASVVLVEDSCQADLSDNVVCVSSDEALTDVGNDDSNVPETQEEPKDKQGDDVTDGSVMPVCIEESPTREGSQDDLKDILPDGRFKKVISTPIIKLQKLSMKDIEQYSPKLLTESIENTEIVAAQLESESSPQIVTGQDEPVPKETPRFRRYKSDEIHVRSATPKRNRRWNSLTEIAQSESKIMPTKAPNLRPRKATRAIELSGLQASQKDLAELAEKFELDGIAPLVDEGDLDESLDECLAKVRERIQSNSPPSLQQGDSDPKNDENDMPVLEHEMSNGAANTSHIESFICSQQDLFSNAPEGECIKKSQTLDTEEDTVSSQNDADDTNASQLVSSQPSATKRKRGRQRKSEKNESVKKEVNHIDSQKSDEIPCSVDSSQMDEAEPKKARKRGRPSKKEKNVDKKSVTFKQEESFVHMDDDKSEKVEGNNEEVIADRVPKELSLSKAETVTDDVTTLSEKLNECSDVKDAAIDHASDANSSSEDLFASCASTIPPTQDQVQEADCKAEKIAEAKQESEGEGNDDDDDDIPLVNLKKSVAACKMADTVNVTIKDTCLDIQESEDSEVDFPMMTPECKDNKYSPMVETPPKEVLSDLLKKRGNKEQISKSECDSATEKDDPEKCTVTRSGRKSKPSSKVRYAKGLVRKAVRSPESKRLIKIAGRLKADGSVSPVQISPKPLKSLAGEAVVDTSLRTKKLEKRKETEEVSLSLSDSSIKMDAKALEMDSSPIERLPDESVSTFRISQDSLQILDTKLADQCTPLTHLSPPRVRSARKPGLVSPPTSPLSSQALRSCLSGRVSKSRARMRSRSPVSLRLKAKRLCTTGPRQTRSGRKLSRVEIKKRNKTKSTYKQTDVEEEERNVVDVIEIKDSESQVEDDQNIVTEEAVNVGETSLSTQGEHAAEDVNNVVKESTSCKEDVKIDDAGSENVEEPSGEDQDQIDCDGDVEMKEVEEETTCQTEGITKDEGVIVQDEVIEDANNVKELEEEDAKDQVDHDGDAEMIELEETEMEKETTSQPVGDCEEEEVAQDQKQEQEIIVPAEKDDVTEMGASVKIRGKRSSQRLEFGDDVDPAGKEPSALAEPKDKMDECEALSDDSDDDDEDNDDELAEEGESSDTSSSNDESDPEGDDVDDDEKEGQVGQVGNETPSSEKEKSDDGAMKEDGATKEEHVTGIAFEETGLDYCDNDEDEDVVNSSQSPIKMTSQVDEIQQSESNQTSSQRLNFPNLSPAGSETEEPASPDKPRTADTCATNIQVSPIIPTKFGPVMQGSPEGASVRPAWTYDVNSPEGSIPHVYSPTASPSTGILKNRDGNFSNSPSPSSKNRRVSFADKVFVEPEPVNEGTKPDKRIPEGGEGAMPHPPSPLVTSASKVINMNSKYITTPSKGSPDNLKSSSSSLQRFRRRSPHSRRSKGSRLDKKTFMRSSYASKVFSMSQHQSESKKSSQSQNTQGTLTQGSPSTQLDSSLDLQGESQGSVFPDLVECSSPVEAILPQLTSSMWSRGLGQLVRARNILTVGDLSALSPMQVQSLPIKSPKISHLRNVLTSFQNTKFPNMKAAKVKSSDARSEVDGLMETQGSVNSDPSSTPPGPPTPQTSAAAIDNAPKRPHDLSPPRSPQQTTNSLVERLRALVAEFREDDLESLPTHELFRAHGHVNSLMESIVGALKTKCHSPSMVKEGP